MSEVKQKKTRSQQIRDSKRRIYDYREIQVRKDGGNGFTLDELKNVAAICGESINGFILQAINDRIEKIRS